LIQYALRNVNGDLTQLNDSTIDTIARKSLSLGDDNFSFENKIVEKSSLPGSVQLGERRLMARELTLFFNRSESSDSDFRTAENKLLQALDTAVYLVDVTNSRQVPISVLDYNAEYDAGSYQHSSGNQINLQLLQPFWTSTTVTTVSQSLIIDLNQITMSELGYLPIPPIITFTASLPILELQIYVDETNEGIQIEDDLFGTTGYTTLILDCEQGTLKLGSVNRVNSIVPGTGFFRLPIGQSTLNIIPTAACAVQIDRYERTYI
jgi:hypothetical protein